MEDFNFAYNGEEGMAIFGHFRLRPNLGLGGFRKYSIEQLAPLLQK